MSHTSSTVIHLNNIKYIEELPKLETNFLDTQDQLQFASEQLKEKTQILNDLASNLRVNITDNKDCIAKEYDGDNETKLLTQQINEIHQQQLALITLIESDEQVEVFENVEKINRTIDEKEMKKYVKICEIYSKNFDMDIKCLSYSNSECHVMIDLMYQSKCCNLPFLVTFNRETKEVINFKDKSSIFTANQVKKIKNFINKKESFKLMYYVRSKIYNHLGYEH